MWKEIERVLKPRAAVLVFSSQPFSSLVVASNLNWYKYSWIWEKPQGANFLNFKFQPSKVHEEILVFGDGATSFSKLGNNLAYYPIMEQGDPYHIKKHGVGNAVARDAKTRNNKTIETINSGTRYPKSVLKYALDRSGWHPTLKPVDLVGYLVKTYSRPGGLVLDFAMGSGTTGVACGRLGRRFIGCDNDVEHGYFETAQRRIKEAYGA
jgi:site-specific DNA-methyltransferase (adenine-specific)